MYVKKTCSNSKILHAQAQGSRGWLVSTYGQDEIYLDKIPMVLYSAMKKQIKQSE
ncbi:hypothetical protein GLOTRDRAFT_110290 [Gloeophyllum trabeum ATCC 11539]|uniref:Uncharacterized protein n=1 Tax=Gloeophyllum trabeum (strain ATCC 11539 / FP-39264 / Madison 617) TaxID=670483 RepID=S7QHB0_GLOTA|nr:uncharacterized protein GLOTRDRAFT_110290 [Gloeophyllum trabeum ATCC 11539]EPQ58648.1 hypothetical protein GLOTRDRAFT_110290 [Gloeophyllum trabeum ATCC 11539]